MTRRSAVGVFNGNWKNYWKRDLEDTSDRQEFIVEQNKLSFGDALVGLKLVDPAGWEAWFDDDNNIPPVIYWSDSHLIKDLCQRLRTRAETVSSSG